MTLDDIKRPYIDYLIMIVTVILLLMYAFRVI